MFDELAGGVVVESEGVAAVSAKATLVKSAQATQREGRSFIKMFRGGRRRKRPGGYTHLTGENALLRVKRIENIFM